MNFMMKKTYTGNVTGPLIMIILLSNAICTNKRVLDIFADNVFLNCLNVKNFNITTLSTVSSYAKYKY